MLKMALNRNYQFGLLYLIHLLINADGVIQESEELALNKVKEKENISDASFEEFKREVVLKKEREIYQKGIDLINLCTDEEKINAFVHLYKISEADGNVHVKEVRLLLYSIKMAHIEFDDVVKRANQIHV